MSCRSLALRFTGTWMVADSSNGSGSAGRSRPVQLAGQIGIETMQVGACNPRHQLPTFAPQPGPCQLSTGCDKLCPSSASSGSKLGDSDSCLDARRGTRTRTHAGQASQQAHTAGAPSLPPAHSDRASFPAHAGTAVHRHRSQAHLWTDARLTQPPSGTHLSTRYRSGSLSRWIPRP